jgi:type IV conjugative transfer system protein TraE
MKLNKYMGEHYNLLRKYRIGLLFMAVLCLITLVSTITAYRALHYTRTVFVPTAFANTSFEVTDRSISKEGIRMYTRYAFDLLLNYTPISAKSKFAEMVPMIHTRYFDEVNAELSGQLDTIERMKIVSSFQIEPPIILAESTNTITVKGIRTRSTYGEKVDESVEKWELRYQVVDANFKIMRIKKIEG